MTLSEKEVKFNFTENIYMDIEFDKLKSNYMQLVKLQTNNIYIHS